MIAKLYALGGLLALAGVVTADVCHAPAYPAQVYAPAYVAPATIVLPLYGASYSEADPESALALQAILEELKAMRQEIAALRSPAGPQPQAAPKIDPVKVLAANCAGCHTPGPKLKGEFEIFAPDGKPLKLNGPDRRAIEKRVREGTMPPPGGPKLSADDRAAIAAFVASPPAATPAKLPPAKK